MQFLLKSNQECEPINKHRIALTFDIEIKERILIIYSLINDDISGSSLWVKKEIIWINIKNEIKLEITKW